MEVNSSPVLWPMNSSDTLLPNYLASLVSYVAKAGTLALRFGSYAVETILDSTRLATLAVSKLIGRSAEGILTTASREVPGSDVWSKNAMETVEKFGRASNFSASVVFHFISSVASTIIFLSQDMLHLLNGMFGQTETSRALSNISGVIRREIGERNGFYEMFSGLCYLLLLQSRYWKLSSPNIETIPLWDVLLLATGGSIARRIPANDQLSVSDDLNIKELLEMLPVHTRYRVTLSETTKRLYTIEIVLEDSAAYVPQLSIPPGARIIQSTSVQFSEGSKLHKFVVEHELKAKQQQTGYSERTQVLDASEDGNEVSDYPLKHSQYVIHETAVPFPSGALIDCVAKYMRFSAASYGQTFLRIFGLNEAKSRFPNSDFAHGEHYSFAHHARLNASDILLSSYYDRASAEKAGIPLVHFAALDLEARAVVLTIRGTLGLEDILTDCMFGYDDCEWGGVQGKAHSGMLRCAQLLCRPQNPTLKVIKDALEDNPDFGLVICGHSLGAGVGALFAMLLSEEKEGVFYTKPGLLPAGRRIKCFSFAPPASVSNDIRKATLGLVTSIVYGLDIVPCLSLGLIHDFQAVAALVRKDTNGTLYKLAKQVISEVSTRRDPLAAHHGDNDFVKSILKSFRSAMRAEKLLPPGEVIHINTSTVYEHLEGHNVKATRIRGDIIVDAEKRFGEPYFGRGIFHHSPYFYERALTSLEEAVHQL